MADTQSASDRTNSEIRAALARRRKTQRDLGDLLGVGQPAIAARLSGGQDWRLAELRAVAGFLDVPLATLLQDGGVVAS
jgi:transcriptional regulator with XRE-family HTH domain